MHSHSSAISQHTKMSEGLNWYGTGDERRHVLEPEDYDNLTMEMRAQGATDEQVAETIKEYEVSAIRMTMLKLMRVGLVEVGKIDEDGELFFQNTTAGAQVVEDHIANLSEEDEETEEN